MKTTFDSLEIVHSLLNVQSLTDNISGKLCYQDERLIDIDLEDVVINSQTITDSNIQTANVNVNIYVPDIKIKGPNAYYPAPDRHRLRELTDLVVGLFNGLKGVYFKNGSLRVKTISDAFSEPEIKQHFISIRLKVSLHQCS